ncbi:MAG: DUF2799 domain-containing protein [Pigmentiphaga sp.]|nr:DUF2799 domain-containing protein [Pigmentiphaga sp.]
MPTLPISSFRPLAAAAVLAVLAGCATMSAEECRTADWYEIGMRDGQNGKSRSYFDEHVTSCKDAGVRPDLARYTAGRDIGIRRFCTPDNGFEMGRQGNYYGNACPADLEYAFLQRYRAGKVIHDAQRRVDDLDTRLRERERKLDRSKDDKEREQLRREIRDLDRDLRRARDDLWDAERRARR